MPFHRSPWEPARERLRLRHPVRNIRPYQPVAKVVTAFDRPCIPADCVAIREGDHKSRPYMHPNRALSGGRRNGLDARETFTTGCYRNLTSTRVRTGLAPPFGVASRARY